MKSKNVITIIIAAILVAIGISSYWLGTLTNERSHNRPFSDTLIWNLLPNGRAEISACEKKILMKAILLNYLISEHIEPISDKFYQSAVVALSENTTASERISLFDQIIKDVSRINKNRGTFLSDEGVVCLIVPWGSDRIDRDCNGDECKIYLNKLRNNFLKDRFP